MATVLCEKLYTHFPFINPQVGRILDLPELILKTHLTTLNAPTAAQAPKPRLEKRPPGVRASFTIEKVVAG